MVAIEKVNGRMALRDTAAQVLRWGEEVSPRGQRTKEMRHFTVQIEDPYDTLCTGINANYSLEIAAAEAIQLIGAFSNPSFAIRHVPALANFTNQHGEFDGAYGPRAADVVPYVVARLIRDRDTRQAIIPIWNARDAKRQVSKDFPCTLSLGFFIRHDMLELDVTMRSNDVCWGLKYDVFQFSQLQLTIAALLGIKAGPYRHTALSMHLYERDWEWAENLSTERDKLTWPVLQHPMGIDGASDSPLDMMMRARQIALNDNELSFNLTPSERWYREVLHP